LHISDNPVLNESEGKLNSESNYEATEIKAFSGQALNQLRVQQSTKDGNFLHLILS